MREIIATGHRNGDDDKRAEIDETMEMLTGKSRKIAEHGRRADGIVKSMLTAEGEGTIVKFTLPLQHSGRSHEMV